MKSPLYSISGIIHNQDHIQQLLDRFLHVHSFYRHISIDNQMIMNLPFLKVGFRVPYNVLRIKNANKGNLGGAWRSLLYTIRQCKFNIVALSHKPFHIFPTGIMYNGFSSSDMFRILLTSASLKAPTTPVPRLRETACK